MQVSVASFKSEVPTNSVKQASFVTIRRMLRLRMFPLLCLMVLVFLPVQASDPEELKAAFQNAIDQMREKDLDGFLECWHPEAVLYTRHDLFAVDRGASEYDAWADIVEDFFARIIRAEFRPISLKYRVVEDIGMVWGSTRFAVDPKFGGGSDFDSRLTAIFAKTADGWKIVNWHSSAVPRQNRGQ